MRLRSSLLLPAAAAMLLSIALPVPIHAAPPETVPSPPSASPPDDAADKAADDASAVPLGPVEVRGKRNLFEEQAARRKRLLEGSAPCMGCDARPREHIPGLLESIARYGLNQVTPQAPKEQDAAGAAASQQVNDRDFPVNRNP